ncbi:Similar to Psi-producing oxygenase A; acc. no. Q6RET3 [Pyronema omphalodes CBS 100304]|uniref:Similar to Psi-producing oxygenase A acc. no. Q6RET3 n=1 Tax=Pyronema omphalodes (strain CBS 100304) TaxID=1076935 RepID=U4LDT2_PYROM|nr:Similar to Psi-producing oxygenase A; acc. no. Q6RET3 [Pyronema omphalodes CBS 100304]
MFFDLDPTKSWAFRRDATTGVETLAKKLLPIISAMEGHHGLSIFEGISNLLYPAKEDVGLGNSFIKSLYQQGKSAEEITWIIIMLLSNTVGNSAHDVSFSITHHKRKAHKTYLWWIIDFYLAPENKEHWADIQALARSESCPESNEQHLRYALEAHRLNQPVTIIRQESFDSLVGNANQGEDYHLNAGDYVSCDIVASAYRDETAFPDPDSVKLDRPLEAYLPWGDSVPGFADVIKRINNMQAVAWLKVLATLRNLRRGQGDQGRLKVSTDSRGVTRYMTADWAREVSYPENMKVQFDMLYFQEKIVTMENE